MNTRCEMITRSNLLWQNGRYVDLNQKVPGYTNIVCYDLNNSGCILAYATKTVDDNGNPIPLPQRHSTRVVLLPVDISLTYGFPN